MMKDNVEKLAIKCDERNLKSYSQESLVYDEKRYAGISGEFLFDALNEQLDKLIDPELVLDVATGTGRVPIALAHKCKKIVGIDITPAMIEKAKEKAEKLGLKNVSFDIGNGRKLPYDSNTFSTITCARFFHLIPFELQNSFLDEFYRCLKPGGRIIVEYNNPFCNFGFELIRSYKARRGAPNMIWPWRMLQLRHKYHLVKTVGVILPFHLKIKHIFPQYYKFYTSLSTNWAYKWTSRFMLVVFEKE